MKLFQPCLLCLLLTSVTGFLANAPTRKITSLWSSPIKGREQLTRFDEVDCTFRTSEMDLEKIKQRVSRKATEEQQTINKGLQKELT